MTNPVPPKLKGSSTASPAATQASPNLTLHGARIVSDACLAKAQSMGLPMNIAIVDSTLHLLHFQRMPGAKLTSIDIAVSKAFTAAGHRIPTHNYKEMVWPGGAAYGINVTNQGRFSVIGGGLPITVDGQVVGAVGCSTGTPAQDLEVAQAGLDAVLQYITKEGHQVKAKL